MRTDVRECDNEGLVLVEFTSGWHAIPQEGWKDGLHADLLYAVAAWIGGREAEHPGGYARSIEFRTEEGCHNLEDSARLVAELVWTEGPMTKGPAS